MPKEDPQATVSSPELDEIISAQDEPGADALTSEEEAQKLLAELAAQEDEGTPQASEEPAKGEAPTGESEEAPDFESLPEEYREAAEVFFQKQDRAQTLEELLGGKHVRTEPAAEKPRGNDRKPISYTVKGLPEELQDTVGPVLEGMANEFSARIQAAEERAERAEQRLTQTQEETSKDKFYENMERLAEKLGPKRFQRILPRAVQHLQEAPGMAGTNKGISKAFDMANKELVFIEAALKGKAKRNAGTVRPSRAASTTSSAEPKGTMGADVSTRDAVRAAARQMKQMGVQLPDGF